MARSMVGALVVFCATYLVIASRRMKWTALDRPAGALLGAVAMVAVGGLPLDAALAAIDLHVITLLFGVLVIAAYLHEAQLFRFVAYRVVMRARSATALLIGLVWVAGALSALMVNDTVCVVFAPLVVAVVVEARLPALPYLIALASAANVGGVVSFSGNPQNMLIGAAAHGVVGFAAYFALTLPIGVACLAANGWILARWFRSELPAGPLAERSLPRPALDRRLCVKGLVALAVFAVLAFAGVALAAASMVAAAGLIAVARVPPRRVFAVIDWPLLVLFAGLFVVVAGVAHAGVLDRAFAALAPVLTRGDALAVVAFVALVVIGSNVVSNVPLVVIAVHWIPKLPSPSWGYVMLAVCSTLAGNLTMFGSIANVIVFEAAGARGDVGFWRFVRIGAVITLIDLVIALAILDAEHALGVARLLGL